MFNFSNVAEKLQLRALVWKLAEINGAEMQFPIEIVFKILTFAPTIYVQDASGQLIGYVRQKLFALKENVTVYSDESQNTEHYRILADRIIDFNANYHLTAAGGRSIGYVRRQGVRSLWRANYDIHLGDEKVFEVHEQSVLARFLDSLVGEIPLVGLLTGYFFNPIYNVTRADGSMALRVVKHRSFLESRFVIEQHGKLSPPEQECVMLGLVMMVLLERARG
jgi:uncharacterized protein YxjI